ncbi:steroidogenic acute regulatory protein-like [Episyrphus balteatus]|uniref:steroidogenic acute regulatory protein-like n=1 Tax=Episyrphus balteatus TaxID=286459 RepID=UPI002485B58D|nr:steroidogenic acute regulatory protein-like [Episyrphus balteatus]
MPREHADGIRIAAEAIYSNARPMNHRGPYQPQFDYNRAHAVNLLSEDFLGGYMQDGRMSVVRRFFCLFVTFDLFFVSFLWIICIMLHGGTIMDALQKQVVHYTIYTSLFDVVGTAICRFVALVLFYGLFYMNHWSIIALSTTASCAFLISKVFFFDWVHSPEPVFGVVLVLTSFVLSWGEAWFFDGRVIPQERHARSYLAALSSNDRSPLMAPFLASEGERPPPESVFYSPFDTRQNSDDEEEQDEDYRQQGLECVRKCYQLLKASDWKVEKVTQKNDTIQSINREKLGKIYRLTGRIKFPAKALLEELFYKIEDVPKWNPTLLESKILRKINTYTDISYNATTSGGGGIVKSRDFVNLRCWRLCCDGRVIEDSDSEEYKNKEDDDDDDENILNRSCEGSVSTISGDNDYVPGGSANSNVRTSRSSMKLGENMSPPNAGMYRTLSQSLGAKGFQGHLDFPDPPPLDEDFHDAEETPVSEVKKSTEPPKEKDRIYVSAAISIVYPGMPPIPKYTRGENLISCWAMREVEGKSDVCIFEWLLCLDLKGYMPRYVLDNTYTTFMTDYMLYLRKYVCELREKRKRSASHHRYSATVEDD